MFSPYLNAAKQGKNDWWRYPAVMLSSFIASILLWNLMLIILGFVGGIITTVVTDTSLTTAMEDDSWMNSPEIDLAFLALLAWSFKLSFERLHKRSVFALFSPDSSIQWKRIWIAFAVCCILSPPIYAISFLVNPSRYSFSFDIEQWFSLHSLVYINFGIGYSFLYALWFGYFLQGVSLLITRPSLAILILGTSLAFIGSIFGINEENYSWVQNFSFYLISYIFILWLIKKENRIELVIGMGLFSTLLDFIFQPAIEAEDSIPTPEAIITISAPYNFTTSFIFFLLKIVLFYIIYRKFLATIQLRS